MGITFQRFDTRYYAVGAELILARDYGVIGDGVTLCAGFLNLAIAAAAVQNIKRVLLPSGIVLLEGPVTLVSNIEIIIPLGCTVRKVFGGTFHMFTTPGVLDPLSNCHISGEGIIDANASLGQTLYANIAFLNVTRGSIKGPEIINGDGPGIRVDTSTQCLIDSAKARNCNHAGILLTNSTYCTVSNPICVDNGEAFVGLLSGIFLDGVTTDCIIANPISYDSRAPGSKNQAYGVVEQVGSGCDRNIVLGGLLTGNATGPVKLLGDRSAWINSRAIGNANSRDFGAIGDGTADDVTAIQATIDAEP